MATKHQNMVKLVERLKTNPMSQTEIARFFCVTPRTVMRYIKEMEETTPGFNRHPINGRQYKYSVQEDDDFSPKLLRDIEKMQEQFSCLFFLYTPFNLSNEFTFFFFCNFFNFK